MPGAYEGSGRYQISIINATNRGKVNRMLDAFRVANPDFPQITADVGKTGTVISVEGVNHEAAYALQQHVKNKFPMASLFQVDQLGRTISRGSALSWAP